MVSSLQVQEEFGMRRDWIFGITVKICKKHIKLVESEHTIRRAVGNLSGAVLVPIIYKGFHALYLEIEFQLRESRNEDIMAML